MITGSGDSSQLHYITYIASPPFYQELRGISLRTETFTWLLLIVIILLSLILTEYNCY